MLIVKTKVKEEIGSFKISKDFQNMLNQKVQVLIKEACQRATANGRTTIMARDL